MQWFRMYSKFASDLVVQSLAFEDQRHFVILLCLKADGTLDRSIPKANRDRLIYRGLGLDPHAAEEAKKRLLESQLIDKNWQPRSWNKLQFVSDDSAPRVRKSRANKETGNGQSSLPSSDGNAPRSRSREQIQKADPDPVEKSLDRMDQYPEIVGVTATPISPGSAVWAAYADAYHNRYGTEPVRNAKVNSQIAQLVQRLGADEAPHVARHYVASNHGFYVRQGHAVGYLLADAEKLRTEWATNTRITETRARQIDQRDTQGQVWARLIAEAESKEAKGREH